jgi:glycosyltransferase involved in cell wall biosynthesis
LTISLSVVIPCFNEENTIEKVLRAVRKLPITPLEIIVVDDASTDSSLKVIEEQCAGLVDKLILCDTNKGKGAALRIGFAAASMDLVIVQDADLEYDPQEIPKLVAIIADRQADVVYGSRFLGGEARRVLLFWHSVGNKFLTTLSNMFTNLNLTDMETCYKLFRREVLQSIPLRENRFGFEPEITAKISKQRLRIYEVGISYSGRTYAEGKKIGWKDGFRAMYCIVKYALVD